MLRRQQKIHSQIQRLSDAGLFGIGFWLAHLIRSNWEIAIFGGAPRIEPFRDFVGYLLVVIPLAPLLLHFQGYYSRPLVASRRWIVWQLLRACTLAVLGVIIVMFLQRVQLSRMVIILFGFTSFGLVLLKEELMRWWLQSKLGREQMKRRMIVAGTQEDLERLRLEFQTHPAGDLEIVDQLDLQNIELDRLVVSLHEHSANGVLLNAKHTLFGHIEKVIQVCELEGVEVWLLADFFQTQISRTTFDELNGRPMLVFRSTPEVSWQAVAKQAMDLVGAAILLMILGLPMLLLAALIKLTSPGPVLFRQERSGLNGKPFTMLKFRSMVSNAEQRKQELAVFNEMSGPVFKITDDPRITPIGRYLRRFSLDEFPQLFNVFWGEMSLVGPRPLPVDEVKRFDDLSHRRRLSVKPGLTCLWQVSGRNNVKDFADWVRLDLEYIDNWTLWLDLKILMRTIPAVLRGTGAK
jgi:exopolysaccharide biosynthesis polyprenyl glycosylphosphotransferase